MLAFHRNRHAATEHPWEHAHAAPEDRALGFELQLIELTHQRETLDATEVGAVDAEIRELLAELAEIGRLLPAAG